jgi:hypothetical protein
VGIVDGSPFFRRAGELTMDASQLVHPRFAGTPQLIFRAVVVVAVVASGCSAELDERTSSQPSDADAEAEAGNETPDRISSSKDELVLWGCEEILNDCTKRRRGQSCRAWLKYC